MGEQEQAPAKSGDRWSHPLTVGVIVALIALVGTLSAAVIDGSDGDGSSAGSAPRAETRLAVDGFQSVVRDHKLVVTAHGSAHGLADGGAVYVVVEPTARGAGGASGGGRTWFRSKPTRPNRAGVWEATIDAPSKVRAGFIVFAVQTYACLTEDCVTPFNPSPATAARSDPVPGFSSG